METNHRSYTRPTLPHERPSCLPLLTEDDFCKAKYSYNDQRCYTARMLDVFLKDESPYVAAYREFRLASMDYMYAHHCKIMLLAVLIEQKVGTRSRQL